MGVAPHPRGAGGSPPFSLTALLLMLAKPSTQLTMHTHPSAGVFNLLNSAFTQRREEEEESVCFTLELGRYRFFKVGIGFGFRFFRTNLPLLIE